MEGYGIFDQLLEGIQVISPDMTYLYVNESVARQAGKSRHELLGKKMLDVFPVLEHSMVYRHIQECLKTGEPVDFENIFEHEDGRVTFYDLRIRPVSQGILIMSLDISRKKEHEYKLEQQIEKITKELYHEHEALQQKQQENIGLRKKYRYVLDNIQDGIALINKDHQIFFVNHSLNDFIMAIFHRKALPGMDYRDFVLPQLKEVYNNAFEKGKTGQSSHTHDVLSGDGYDLHMEFTMTPIMEDNGEFFGNFIVVQDRTERKSFEDALSQSEMKFRDLVEKSMVGVYILQNDCFAYVNPRFEEIFGYGVGELQDLPIRTVVSIESQETVASNINKRLSGEVSSIRYIGKGLKKNGENNWFEVYGSVSTYLGKPAIIGTMIDITEKVATDETLKELNYQLRERVKELTLISRFGEMIRSKGSLAEKLKTYIQSIPSGWQFPDICSVKIKLDKDLFETQNYQSGVHQMRYDFDLPYGESGYIEVNYTDDARVDSVQPFLNEEYNLIKVLAEMLQVEHSEKWITEQNILIQAHLETIFTHTKTAYILVDKNLKLISYNHQAVTFSSEELGIPEARFSDLMEYVKEDKKGNTLLNIQKALSGEIQTYDSHYPHPDGDRWYEVKIIPVLDDRKIAHHILIAVDEITGRKQEEERVHLQLELFKDLSFITSHELRHEYAKLHSLVELLSNVNEIDSELREVLNESRQIFDNLNSSISKLNKKISFSQAETLYRQTGLPKVNRIMLVDDDALTNLIHTKIIQKYNNKLELHTFESAEMALQHLAESPRIDDTLVFLDLNMPEMSGWDFLDAMDKRGTQPQVAIVSSSIDPEDRKKARNYGMVREFISKPLNTRILEKIIS